ncbi:MAG: serpin family protein [Bacteroidota bacterium]
MKKYGILLSSFLIFLGCIFGTACRSSRNQVTADPVSSPSTVSEGNRLFALSFFGQAVPDNENFVFSPYSISAAMSMVYAGAGGNTATQMEQVLHFPPLSPEVFRQFHDLNNALASSDSAVSLNIANSLWIQEKYDVLPGFAGIMKDEYDAPARLVDFISAPAREKARGQINSWTSERTGDRIREILPPNTLTENTRLVLTNALYFKGAWLNTFSKAQTRPAPFYKKDWTTVQASFMHATSNIRFFSSDTLRAVSLPYEAQKYSMLLILPEGKWTVESLLPRLNETLISRILAGQVHQSVDLSLPKFEINTSLNVKEYLMKMGLTEPFELTADLSGITGNKELKVDDVLHKAFIEVNEEGTEAAAATAVTIGLKAAYPGEPVRFNADHPFIFLLRESRTGTVLFAGVVYDPTAGK